MDSQELALKYQTILSTLDTAHLDRHRPPDHIAQGLSGLFLSSVPPNIQNAARRIMVVGSETAGWNVLQKGERFSSLATYVTRSMAKHQELFAEQLESTDARGSTFHNFMRTVADRCGKNGLLYANLFCFDWLKGSPIGCPHFDMVKHYSELLLKAQISFFQPHIIIFANGMNSVKYRREFFPIQGSDKACTQSQDYRSEGISKHHLWRFKLHDTIDAFRIHHPSSFSKEAARARDFLVNLLPAA